MKYNAAVGVLSPIPILMTWIVFSAISPDVAEAALAEESPVEETLIDETLAEGDQVTESSPDNTPVDQRSTDPDSMAITPVETGPVAESLTEGIAAEAPLDNDRMDPGRRVEAQKRFLRLIDEERFEEATAAALHVVTLTREEFGEDSMELITPLVNLATAQMRTDDLISAEANYRQCIAIIEKNEGKLSRRLINPLNGLGATYNRSGLYEQGIAAYERALRINHVNDGFYNFDQFKMHDGLTESYLGLQEMEEADFYQKTQLEIRQRKLDARDPAIVPGLYKLAEWYRRTGQVEAAEQTYLNADRILRRSGDGEANLDRVQALRGLAQNRVEGFGDPSGGANALKKAVSIIDSQPNPDYELRAIVLIDLGDLYTSVGKSASADERYAEAWQNLSHDDELLDLRDHYFSAPVRLRGRAFSTLEYAPDSKGKPFLKSGHVLVSYTVTSRGRVEDVKVIESEPPGIMDKPLVSTLSRSVFRPRREDGVAVDTKGKLHQLDFRYTGSVDDEKNDQSGQRLENPESDTEKSDIRGSRLEYPAKPAD